MSYEEFVTEYERALRNMMSYELNQVGSIYFCEKAANLADDYPEFMNRYDSEN
jgi:uroporphyrinogen-III decarboxylase